VHAALRGLRLDQAAAVWHVLTRIDAGQRAYMHILAIVPPCAGECRLVRVTGVLIFANARTCVASVLVTGGPISHRASGRH
jgi:hypothetical protein